MAAGLRLWQDAARASQAGLISRLRQRGAGLHFRSLAGRLAPSFCGEGRSSPVQMCVDQKEFGTPRLLADPAIA